MSIGLIFYAALNMDFNNHYIRIGEDSLITHGFSDAFEQPEFGDILINEQGGRHFELFGEINPPLSTDDGIPLYKWNGKAVQKRTETEIDGDRAKIPSPPLDSLTILQLALAETLENETSTQAPIVRSLSTSPETSSVWAVSMMYKNLVDQKLRTVEQVPERFRGEVYGR